jgi:hypothetical protein
LARGSPPTSVVPTFWKGARYRPRRHQSHPREHFNKGLSIDPSGGNTLARGSLSTSATSIAPSSHFGKGLTVDLGSINRTLANTSARGSPSDLGGTNTLARGSPSTSVISTSPPPTLYQCLDLTFGLKIRTRLQHD